MNGELVARACELLTSAQYINIASVCPDGSPWNTPLYAVYGRGAIRDRELVFYWTSWVNAQHSINIRSNPRVFATLYDSSRKRGDNNRRCLYLAGNAHEGVPEQEMSLVLDDLYGEEAAQMKPADYSGEAIKRVYRFHPEQCWLNDLSERQVTETTVKMRIEVPLAAIIEALPR